MVTDLDVASERLLVEKIRGVFPGHAIEGEEEVLDPLELKGYRWILDPLDGTINFVHGLPAFAVSVALYEDDEPLVGVIHAPLLEIGRAHV